MIDRRQSKVAARERALAAQAEAAASDRLDAFFAALADEDRRQLMLSLGDGVVTGAALSDKLGWSRDETAKQVKILRKGGLIDGQRDGRWVRLVPQLDGVEAAKAWVMGLRSEAPPPELPNTTPEQRVERARALRTAARRSLLTQVCKLGEAAQVELARACGLSQPVTLRGLAQLEVCGLVSVQREGRRPRYAADFAAVERLWSWLGAVETLLIKGRHIAQTVHLRAPGEELDAELEASAQTD